MFGLLREGTVDYRVDKTAEGLVITLSGRLSFQDSSRFPEVLQHVRGVGLPIDIQLGALDFIDSTGLSLLLRLYDAAFDLGGGKFIISNAKGMVKAALHNAQFENLFQFR